MSKSPDPMIGSVVGGNLEILEHIATGAAGTVYRAMQKSTRRPVAVKVIGTDASTADEAHRHFEAEARALSRLTHPHAVRLYDCGQIDETRWFLSMELLEGRSLEQLLKNDRLPYLRALEIVDDVAAVLAEAHAHGIVHRDVKPGNIFLQRVGPQECVRLLDFGIAKVNEQPSALDQPAGTPKYMAPEQIRGSEIDGRADIYSLGMVAYESIGGSLPFDSQTPATIMAHQVVVPIPPLREHAPDVPIPPPVETFVSRMLAKDPNQRPASMAEVRAQLRVLTRLRVGTTVSSTNTIFAKEHTEPRATKAESPVSNDTTSPAPAPPSELVLDELVFDEPPSDGPFEDATSPLALDDSSRFTWIFAIAMLLVLVGFLLLRKSIRPWSWAPIETPVAATDRRLPSSSNSNSLTGPTALSSTKTEAPTPSRAAMPSATAARSADAEPVVASPRGPNATTDLGASKPVAPVTRSPSSSTSSTEKDASTPPTAVPRPSEAPANALNAASSPTPPVPPQPPAPAAATVPSPAFDSRPSEYVTVPACYELVGRKELFDPQLFVDGRRVRGAARRRCYQLRLKPGLHVFSLRAEDGVSITLRQRVDQRTDGVFFLVY